MKIYKICLTYLGGTWGHDILQYRALTAKREEKRISNIMDVRRESFLSRKLFHILFSLRFDSLVLTHTSHRVKSRVSNLWSVGQNWPIWALIQTAALFFPLPHSPACPHLPEIKLWTYKHTRQPLHWLLVRQDARMGSMQPKRSCKENADWIFFKLSSIWNSTLGLEWQPMN